MNPETFPFKAIRQFAGAIATYKNGKETVSLCPSRPDYEVVTYHRTLEAAQRTAQSNQDKGYRGIRKSGRVEENR